METTVFASVAAFVAHLKESGQDAVPTAYVIEQLEAIKPASKSGQRRGVLAGKSLEDMSVEELKREKINAGSVHYKAVQRGAAQETIDKNKARLDAVIARLAELAPAPVVAETSDAVATAEVDSETAAEI